MDFTKFTSDKELVNFILKDQAAMENIRSNYEPLWRKEMAIFQPRSYNFLKEYEDGQQFGKKTLFDYPALASHKFGLGMTGHMISRTDTWVKFVTAKLEKMNSDRVKEYLQEYTEQMIYSFARSNSFYTSAYWTARDYGVIGTAVVWPDENTIDGRMEYKNITIGSICLRKNNLGKYCVLSQKCKISAIDLLDKFGQNALSADVLKAAKDDPFKEFELLIYVSYNSKYKAETLNPEDLKYKVFYVLPKEAEDNKKLIMKSGRNNFPIVVSYGERHDMPYGTSIGAECLNNGLIGNKIVELMLDEANKAQKGIWKVSDTIGKLDLRPGGVNKVSNPNEILENVYRNGGWQIGKDQLQDLKNACNEWFFINFFELLSNPDLPQITAYQAQRMQGEKVAMMSTAIGSFESYLTQAIEIQAEFEKGRLPEPPDELFEGNEDAIDIQPKFIGNLAQLQRQSFKTMGLIDWSSAVQTISQTWPSAKVKVNELELVKQLAEGMGVQEKCVKDDDEVQRILNQIEEEQAQAAQAQMMMEGAKAVPALSKQIESGSPMEFLAGAMK